VHYAPLQYKTVLNAQMKQHVLFAHLDLQDLIASLAQQVSLIIMEFVHLVLLQLTLNVKLVQHHQPV
jgi:hypothetical protein